MLINVHSAAPILQQSICFIPAHPEKLETIWSTLIEQGFSIPPLTQSLFQAKKDQNLTLFKENPAQTVYLFGLGERPNPLVFKQGLRRFVHKHKGLIQHLVLDFQNYPQQLSFMDFNQELKGALSHAIWGTYMLPTFKQKKEEKPSILENIHLIVPTSQLSQIEEITLQANYIAQAEQLTMRLVDAPANTLTPQNLAHEAQKIGKAYGIQVKTYSLKEIKEMGMGGLAGVNQGSEHPATFTVMHYKPTGATQKVALVGKGVTFDTGGISIKPADNMLWMKCDMAGAAAVMGAILGAALLKLPVEVISFIPATENKTGEKALLPSDVIQMYNGKWVEVEDTDAEGRLILADALAYATQNYQPDVLIDLATLTGSCIMALGYEAAGLFSQNQGLIQDLVHAGNETWQRVWQLPLWEEYNNQILSDVADLKNLGGRGGGAITAAKFLEHFTNEHPNYAHLDIAGVAFTDSEFTKMRSASGFGVRLLLQYLETISKSNP